MSHPVIFLDRDGTINYDPGYLNDPNDVKLIEGTGEALKLLKKAGYLLLVVSNQSGIARGLISDEQVKAVNDRINELLESYYSVKIDHFYYCPHHELFSSTEDCDCRKPATGLFTKAMKDYEIDLENSFMVGDSQADIIAAHNFGLTPIMVSTGNGRDHISGLQDQNKMPKFTCLNLYESAKLIIKLKSGVSAC